MIEKAFSGTRGYWSWMIFLLVVIGAGFLCYLRQWDAGLSITGLSRNVSWGLYIANFTFFVGVAASAVMVVLPYYLHHTKEFRKITVLGEFLAVVANRSVWLQGRVLPGPPRFAFGYAWRSHARRRQSVPGVARSAKTCCQARQAYRGEGGPAQPRMTKVKRV